MNIEFEYRYRDWGNFKRYGSVVFQNQQRLTAEEISQKVLRTLTDGQFFDASQFAIPELFFRDFPFDPDLDHGLHEFFSVSETKQAANDALNRDILDLLLKMETFAAAHV